MVDLNKIRDRLKSITHSDKDSSLWKPSPGSQQIRIVPYKFDEEMPFIELYFHYGIKGKSILSLKTFGESDPIAEFSERLKSSGNQDDYRMGRHFEPKLRIYAPMIVRGEESKGVRYWGFGKMVYSELLSIMSDEDYGDISDISNGRDVVVDYKSAEELGKSFPETKVRVKPNQTILYEDLENSKKLLDNQKEIHEIFKKEDYDTLKKHLDDYLNDNTESSNKEEDESSKEVVETTSNVEDAFDDLFNNK